jgi:hypothetical protein
LQFADHLLISSRHNKLMNSQAADALSCFINWVRKDALPLWLGQGLHTSGDWLSSQLSSSGKPVEGQSIHLVSQAQMLYVICRAEQLGWLSGTRRLTRSLIDFAGRHGTLPCRSDGYVRSLASSLGILDGTLDPADHAWFVMANAACFAAFSDMLDLRRAFNIFDWMNIHFADGPAWLGSDQKTRGPPELQRLMLRTFVYMEEVTHRPVWRQRAQGLFRHCMEQYFSSKEDVAVGELSSKSVTERLAWAGVLCRYEHRIEGAGNLARQIYQQALDAASLSRPSEWQRAPSCLAMAEAAGVGLELCAAGMAHEDVVLPYVRRILDCYASQDVPGLFADELELPDAPGSVVTLVSLFDAAVAANRLLTRQ